MDFLLVFQAVAEPPSVPDKSVISSIPILTIMATIAALCSGVAAIVALFLNHKQSRTFERDFIGRNLIDQNNSLNLSRYYKEIFTEVLESVESSIDQISTIQGMIQEPGEIGNFKELFDELEVPQYEFKDYHLINYKPASAYNLIKCQLEIASLTEVIDTYKTIFSKKPSNTPDQQFIPILEKVGQAFQKLKEIVSNGAANIQEHIDEVVVEIENLESRYGKLTT